MIQQRVGDLLEIRYEDRYFYVVVLTPRVMFGGNIVFAFHANGERRDVESLRTTDDGFNVCTDLLPRKRAGEVRRMHRFGELSPFWRTAYAKGTNEYRRGVKAKEWFVYRIDALPGPAVARVADLTPEYRFAMDHECLSFDLVAEKILARYTPDQNEHIQADA
jgi:hypothetical protein